MSGRDNGDPERVAETGGQAITTIQVAHHGGPHPMHENRQKKVSRPAVLQDCGANQPVIRVTGSYSAADARADSAQQAQ
jgi:hypothetical protein